MSPFVSIALDIVEPSSSARCDAEDTPKWT
jgi:hypothetical protein